MPDRVLLAIGTKKGLFVAESGAARRSWTLRGPFAPGVSVYSALIDTRKGGKVYASACNAFFGMKFLASTNKGKSFKETKSAPAFPKDDGRALPNLWSIAAGADKDEIWAGVEPASLFRSGDGGDSWERIEKGLPSRFGFPLVMDHATKALYCFPLDSDEYRMPRGGKFRVYRSRNGGDSWEPVGQGLPDTPVYASVLRGAMAADQLDPCGIYVGTTAGAVYASSDRGDSWRALPGTLPRILHVAAYTGR